MTFLIDAQLPRRLAYWVRQAGYEAVHTLDLPKGNHTQPASGFSANQAASPRSSSDQ